jgi:hypothetical protein
MSLIKILFLNLNYFKTIEIIFLILNPIKLDTLDI